MFRNINFLREKSRVRVTVLAIVCLFSTMAEAKICFLPDGSCGTGKVTGFNQNPNGSGCQYKSRTEAEKGMGECEKAYSPDGNPCWYRKCNSNNDTIFDDYTSCQKGLSQKTNKDKLECTSCGSCYKLVTKSDNTPNKKTCAKTENDCISGVQVFEADGTYDSDNVPCGICKTIETCTGDYSTKYQSQSDCKTGETFSSSGKANGKVCGKCTPQAYTPKTYTITVTDTKIPQPRDTHVSVNNLYKRTVTSTNSSATVDVTTTGTETDRTIVVHCGAGRDCDHGHMNTSDIAVKNGSQWTEKTSFDGSERNIVSQAFTSMYVTLNGKSFTAVSTGSATCVSTSVKDTNGDTYNVVCKSAEQSSTDGTLHIDGYSIICSNGRALRCNSADFVLSNGTVLSVKVTDKNSSTVWESNVNATDSYDIPLAAGSYNISYSLSANNGRYCIQDKNNSSVTICDDGDEQNAFTPGFTVISNPDGVSSINLEANQTENFTPVLEFNNWQFFRCKLIANDKAFCQLYRTELTQDGNLQIVPADEYPATIPGDGGHLYVTIGSNKVKCGGNTDHFNAATYVIVPDADECVQNYTSSYCAFTMDSGGLGKEGAGGQEVYFDYFGFTIESEECN